VSAVRASLQRRIVSAADVIEGGPEWPGVSKAAEDIVPFGVETGEPVRFQGMFHPAGSNLTIAEAKRSRISAFGIEYEGKAGLSTSEFSWAA
jgi:hypothetical protein